MFELKFKIDDEVVVVSNLNVEEYNGLIGKRGVVIDRIQRTNGVENLYLVSLFFNDTEYLCYEQEIEKIGG